MLRVETLTSLGGAEMIVRDHVDSAFRAFDRRELDLSAEMMRYLVTPSGIKVALTVSDLTELTPGAASDVRTIVDRLIEARILRLLAPADDEVEPRVEIFHDVLAPAILEWRRHQKSRLARGRRRLAHTFWMALALFELGLILILLLALLVSR